MILRSYEGLSVSLEDEQSARNFDQIIQKHELLKNLHSRYRQWAMEDNRRMNALENQNREKGRQLRDLQLKTSGKPGAQTRVLPFS